MNKKQTLKEINELISLIDEIKTKYKNTRRFIYWYTKVKTFIADIYGEDSRYFLLFDSIDWNPKGQARANLRNFESVIERKQKEAIIEGLEASSGMLLAIKDDINKTENIESLLDKSDVKKGTNTLLKIIKLVENKLRKVMRDVPKNEKEIQDAFENLLIGAEIDFDREFPVIKYSSKNYIPDFSFSKIDTVLEIKICTLNRKEKALIPEINDDIQAYKSKFTNLIFLIYDTGQIRDSEKFSNSIENDNIMIRIIKH